MEQQVQYIFRKPLWRKIVPLFVILLVWLIPGFIKFSYRLNLSGLPGIVTSTGLQYLHKYGVTVDRTIWGASLISLPLLLWWYLGFEVLLITPDAMVRRVPLGGRRVLKWTEVDEVLIEHIERYFEGKSTALKRLTLYALPRRFIPWRRRMTVSNREFECYHHVERLASEVSVPAISQRKLAQIAAPGRKAYFAELGQTSDALPFLYVALAIALGACWALDRLWIPKYLPYRNYLIWVAVALVLLAIRKFFYRRLALDRKNFYVMRRLWVTKSVPIDQITETEAHDNRVRIIAKKPNWKRPKVVFTGRKFVRNRAVLLHMIRELQEERRLTDATPIIPVSESATNWPALPTYPSPDSEEAQN